MTPKQVELAELAVKELRAGGYLIETRSDEGDWFKYRTSGGTIITAQVISKLVDGGAIEPSGDGLFGDSQSFRLSPHRRRSFDAYCESRFGNGWAQVKTGRRAKSVAPVGKLVSKRDIDDAKDVYRICEAAWA